MDGNGPVVEYNGLPMQNGNSAWLATWFESLKPTFQRRQDEYWKTDSKNIIGRLFLESLEVGEDLHILGETLNTDHFRNVRMIPIFSVSIDKMRLSKRCYFCPGRTKKINLCFTLQ